LYRVNLDGSENELIVDGFGDGGARDLALDVENNIAYVTERNGQGVWEVDIANKTKSLLYTVADDGLGELPVAIDLYNGNLYMTCVEIDAESVWVGPVDGSGVTRIIDYSAGGYGYGLAVDEVNEKIYFDDTDSGNILVANLDGTGIETFTSTAGSVYGIAIDNTNGKVYWSDDGTGNIRMANLDGSNIVDLAVGLDGPKGIFYIE
jgi:DNA-binding beta-propeller fold protein YncE